MNRNFNYNKIFKINGNKIQNFGNKKQINLKENNNKKIYNKINNKINNKKIY